MTDRLTLALLAATLLTLPVTAQTRSGGVGTAGIAIGPGSAAGASGSGSAGVPGFTGRGGMGGPGRIHHGHGRGTIFFPYPYFDSDSDDYTREAPPQSQIVVVPASAPAPAPVPAAPRESLLIEWRGDHFVRSTTSEKDSAGIQMAPDYAAKSGQPAVAARKNAARQQNATPPPRELPPTVLIFHDGHQEEVSEYTIMSGTIYSKADYWTTGSWTRAIQIADLNVPATLKQNQERGLKFTLPASPNEVVVRP